MNGVDCDAALAGLELSAQCYRELVESCLGEAITKRSAPTIIYTAVQRNLVQDGGDVRPDLPVKDDMEAMLDEMLMTFPCLLCFRAGWKCLMVRKGPFDKISRCSPRRGLEEAEFIRTTVLAWNLTIKSSAVWSFQSTGFGPRPVLR